MMANQLMSMDNRPNNQTGIVYRCNMEVQINTLFSNQTTCIHNKREEIVTINLSANKFARSEGHKQEDCYYTGT